MAIPITDKPNTIAPTGPYPYGQIRDNIPSVQSGTPVNKLVMEDYIQFFHKLFAASGLTYNDLPDNQTNGWQFYEALQIAVNNNENLVALGSSFGDWLDGGTLTVTPNVGSVTGVATLYNRYRIKGKTLYWQYCYDVEFLSTVDFMSVSYPSALGAIDPVIPSALAAQVIDQPSPGDFNSVTIVSRNLSGVSIPGQTVMGIFPTHPAAGSPQFALGQHRIYVNAIIEIQPLSI
jgi:hypothetical protein